MSEPMSRDETIKLFDELKSFMMDSLTRIESNSKESANRIETKIDIATDNIDKYAKDTIEHSVKIQNLCKDVDALGKKNRINQNDIKKLQIWQGGVVVGFSVILFVVNYFK